MSIFSLLLILAGLVLLVAGGEVLVRGASSIGRTAGLSSAVIGLTIVAFATSAPELAVSVDAAVSGSHGIALGNVLGSNIINILLVLGLTAAVRALAVGPQLMRSDIPVMIGFSLLAVLLGLDGQYSLIDGLLLVGLLVVYLVLTVRHARKVSSAEDSEDDDGASATSKQGADEDNTQPGNTQLENSEPENTQARPVVTVLRASRGRSVAVDIALIVLGVALLVSGARMLVSGATDVASALGVSDLVIGLTVVAIGTSLPELMTSVIAAIRGRTGMAVGNLVGSNIFNIAAVLGISAVVAPGGLQVDFASVRVDLLVMVASAIIILPLALSSRRIGRWEGWLLTALYVAYVSYVVIASGNQNPTEADRQSAPENGAVGQMLETPVEYTPSSLQDAVAYQDAVEASGELGTQALVELSSGEQNAVVSPASLAMTLAVLAEGADGPALQQLEQVLGATGEPRQQAYSALQAAVGEYDGDPAVVSDEQLPEVPVLHLANQLALRDGAEPEPQLLEALASAFNAALFTVDFGDEDSGTFLNEWVQEHTGGLIDNSAMDLPDEDMAFVIQNAALLAAAWQHPFMAEDTQEREFHRADGEVVNADLMQQQLMTEYAEVDGIETVRLPYTEGFAMELALPAEGDDPAQITHEQWNQLSAAVEPGELPYEVDLGLPVLELDTSDSQSSLKALFENTLGLEDLIEGDDLSDFGFDDVEISQIEQQAVLEVSEEGTVAAAVTEIGVAETSLPVTAGQVQFHLDRPFALRIVHEETNWPLFMSVVHDPTD